MVCQTVILLDAKIRLVLLLMVLMNGGVLTYYSGRQSTAALCTAMAETIALIKLVVRIKHMRALSFAMQTRAGDNN
jgi:hypothetical protein